LYGSTPRFWIAQSGDADCFKNGIGGFYCDNIAICIRIQELLDTRLGNFYRIATIRLLRLVLRNKNMHVRTVHVRNTRSTDV